MTRKLWPALLLAVPIIVGCAGPAKLAERSGDKLEQGDMWRAWSLATKALDKAPAHAGARSAAAAAGRVIADDYQRRIHSLAAVDTAAAAEQALEFVSFRTGAIRYTTIAVSNDWAREEQAIRVGAARVQYENGAEAMATQRPKKAYADFSEAERYWSGYRDAAGRADEAFEKGLTKVAIVPLQAKSGPTDLGRDIAASWRGDLVEHMAPGSYFTRLLPSEEVERGLRVSDLGRMDRDAALRIGRKAGADRVVWGSIGDVDSKSSIHYFRDVVVHRVTSKDKDGHKVTRWVDVPIEVIARVRTVNVDLAYEVISTRGGVTLSHDRNTRTMKARVVWTAYTPEYGADTYALVSDQTRANNPARTKEIESKWSAVVGDGTTLAQVLEAKRSSSKSNSRGEAVARLMAGAAFVMLEDLPSTEELAHGALSGAWQPVYQSLVKLDGVDDVDLGATSASR